MICVCVAWFHSYRVFAILFRCGAVGTLYPLIGFIGSGWLEFRNTATSVSRQDKRWVFSTTFKLSSAPFLFDHARFKAVDSPQHSSGIMRRIISDEKDRVGWWSWTPPKF